MRKLVIISFGGRSRHVCLGLTDLILVKHNPVTVSGRGVPSFTIVLLY